MASPGTAVHEDTDRLLFLAFLLTLIWAPLPVGSNHLWAWSFLEVMVLALATTWLILYALGRVTTTPAFWHAVPLLLLFAVVCGIVALQIAPLPEALVGALSPGALDVHTLAQRPVVLSLDPSGTAAALQKTLAYGVLFALTLLLINTRDRLRILALVLVFSGVFQAAYGALMTLSGLEYGFFTAKVHGIGSVTGTFVNSNHLAGYLEMCLALGVGMMLADRSGEKAAGWRDSLRRLLATLLGDKARVRIALVIMVIGLVLSRSRMGNIAFFSSLLVAGAFYVVVARRISTGIVVFFASVILIDILVIGNFFGIEKVAREIQETTLSSEEGRVDVNKDTLAIIYSYPLTGTGAGSFASTFPMYESGKAGGYMYFEAHNDYLQFASEFGLPAAAMLGIIVLASLITAIRAQIKRRDRMMQGLGCGVMMAIVALLIHSAVDFNLQIPANAATFVVILAMAWQTRWLGHRVRQKKRQIAQDPAPVIEIAEDAQGRGRRDKRLIKRGFAA